MTVLHALSHNYPADVPTAISPDCQFELMHRLLDALKRIMEPPARKKRPLVRRSEPVTARMRPPLRSPKPTDEEAQYLTFFTDYCKRDDFVAYRTRFPDDFDLTFESKRDDAETATASSLSREQTREKERDEDEREPWMNVPRLKT